MPRERKPQYDVINDLRDLSCQADSIIAENVETMNGYNSGFNAWFKAVKDHITLIRDCASIDEITDGPQLSSFLGETYKAKKNIAVTEVQKEHVHSSNLSESKEPKDSSEAVSSVSIALKESVPPEVVNEAPTLAAMVDSLPQIQVKIPKLDISNLHGAISNVSTPAVKTDSLPQIQLKTPKINVSKSSALESTSSCKIISQMETPICKTINLMETPILNRTFNKPFNKTLILDSGAQSDSLKKVENIDSASNGSKVMTESGATNVLVEKIAYSGMLTRSGSKRKSTESANKINKKFRTEVSTSYNKTTANKIAQPKYPLANKNSRTAMTAVIVPPPQQTKSVIAKEQLIREELKKKEEKTKENIKRVLNERQMKVEQIKKTREEKQIKTLQKRMQIEKEKEERQEKINTEVKTALVKNAKENVVKQIAAKSRTQELIDQHIAASKSVVSSSKSNDINGDNVVKTPISRKSSDYESYELTPLPNSSTYNFSDDEEDDKPQGKHIPLWAQGVLLKSALMEQYYHPVDADELFGTVIDPPDLTEIFGVKKKHYMKRTSSAIWNSPPFRS